MTTTGIDAVPRPIGAGAEMAALRRFFRDATWTGTIVAGGMGPGSPEMRAEGGGVHTTLQDGLWICGDYQQDQFLTDGTFVLRWRLHWVAGWDPSAGEYRATHADNYGHAGVMRGRLEGDVLTFESMGDSAVRLRMVWDLTDPGAMTWRNEMSVGGAPFALVEEYRYTFTGG